MSSRESCMLLSTASLVLLAAPVVATLPGTTLTATSMTSTFVVEAMALGHAADPTPSDHDAFRDAHFEFERMLINQALDRSPELRSEKAGARVWAMDVIRVLHDRDDAKSPKDLLPSPQSTNTDPPMPHQRLGEVPELHVLEEMLRLHTGETHTFRLDDLAPELKSYRANRIWLARVATLQTKKYRARAEAWTTAANAWSDAIQQEDWTGMQPRFIAAEFTKAFLKTAPLESVGLVVGSIESDRDADPWLANMLRGAHEVDLAWAARGSGYSSSVSRDAMNSFADHLSRAYTALGKAWDLKPEWPEAASLQITVAMGGGSEESAQVWYDRAADAAWDWQPSTYRILAALSPKWGGSVDALLEYGTKCADAAPPQSEYALNLPVAMQTVLEETGQAAWSDATYERARDIMVAHIRKSTPRNRKWAVASRLAVFAWIAGDWEHCRLATDTCAELGLNVWSRMTSIAGTDALTLHAELDCAELGLLEDVRECADALFEGNMTKADAAIASLDAKNITRPAVRKLFDEFRTYRDAYRALQKGTWYSLSPNGSLGGWSVRSGEFMADRTHAIIGRSNLRPRLRQVPPTPLLLDAVAPAVERMHLTATVRWTRQDGEPGIQLWTSEPRPGVTAGVRITLPRSDQVRITTIGGQGEHVYKAPAPPDTGRRRTTPSTTPTYVTLHVLRWDDEMVVIRNDAIAYRGPVPTGPYGQAGSGSGIGLVGVRPTGGWVEWSDIRMQSLGTRPEAFEIAIDGRATQKVPDVESMPVAGARP